MLTYDSRLLRAARASSGEAIETNAKPLFLVLLCIESQTQHRKPKTYSHQYINHKAKPKFNNNKKIQFLKQRESKRKMLTKTSTSTTLPCFSNKERMSSVVKFQGTFWAINLVFENTSSFSCCFFTFSAGSWVMAEKWRMKLLSLLAFKGRVLVRGEDGGRKQVEETFLMELKLE